MKQDRIELRASQKERERLLEAALEKSDNILKSRDTLTLSNRDRDLFLEALENPPKPNKHLQQAFKVYQKRKNKINFLSPIRKSVAKLNKTKIVTK